MTLTKQGKILYGIVFSLSICLIVLFAFICWSCIIGVLLLDIAFIVFNHYVNKYYNDIIKVNNLETELYAKKNNLKTKNISVKDYERLMTKDGTKLDNIIINKEEVTLI